MVSIDTAVKPTNSHLAKMPSLANEPLMGICSMLCLQRYVFYEVP